MANYRVSTNTNNRNITTQDKTNKKYKKTKNMDQLRPFKLKHDLPKISIDLQTAFAEDTNLAEGQWLKEQLNVVKLHMFRVRTQRPTVSRTERQYLVPPKTFIKNNGSKWRCLIRSACRFNFCNMLS
jgi:hypothetical protein